MKLILCAPLIQPVVDELCYTVVELVVPWNLLKRKNRTRKPILFLLLLQYPGEVRMNLVGSSPVHNSNNYYRKNYKGYVPSGTIRCGSIPYVRFFFQQDDDGRGTSRNMIWGLGINNISESMRL